MLKELLSLFFPNVCQSCGKVLYHSENCICTSCRYFLPQTQFHLDKENAVAKLFWGRVDINSAAAYYNFNKGGSVQRLIHQLKYKGKREIGVTIGKFYGTDLKQSNLFKDVNVVMPVPLHKSKERKRGYNQSEMFAAGIAQAMNIELSTNNLVRIAATETQTKKSRYDRWKNVETVFAITDNLKLENKHILLVDDVITTGATIEACAQKLLEIGNVKLSVATIAYTQY
jgi:ComF family protein